MKVCSFWGERAAAGVWLCLVLLVISACSMQKSAGTLDSSTEDGQKIAEGRTIQQPAQEKEPVRVDYLTPVPDIVSPEIYVYKEKRRLYVIQSNVLVRDYPVGLGFHPSGDKQIEGDGKTPEGNFVICQKNPASRFSKALGLNYPERQHAERAFFAGVLSPTEFKDILVAYERQVTPPWHTKLGGQIFIHAGGAQRDWTDGCVALYNSDMTELFEIASMGTPVHIRP